MPRPAPRLRKREIVLAVAAGGLAAAAAAAILDDSGSSAPFVAASVKPNYENLEQFEAISTVGPQDVVVTYGETQSVRAEGSPQALAMLEVVVEDGVLNIRPREEGWMWAWGGLNSTTYHVTMPRLTSVNSDGSGDIRVDRIEGQAFSGTISRSGDLSIGSLKVDSADFTINGPGSIAASGTARETRVRIDGPGDVSANGLRSGIANVMVNGPGDVELTVDDLANISLNGPGDVEIAGSARCSVSEQGPGDVNCEGGTN